LHPSCSYWPAPNLFNVILELDADTTIVERAPDRKGLPDALVTLGSLGWKPTEEHGSYILHPVPKATTDLIQQIQRGGCWFNLRISHALRV
jgi:hypothetical protein